MNRFVRHGVQRLFHRLGFSIERLSRSREHMQDAEPEFFELANACKPFTMTSYERLYALYGALEYIVSSEVPGDVVECGVWRGGSSMMAASTLSRLGDTARKLYLYDTFEGMSPPTEVDVRFDGQLASEQMDDPRFREMLVADLESVERNLARTEYPTDRLVFIQGRVEETIPGVVPDRIALLRLDTDWYESTCHEMEHLFPRLSVGGVLIVDDYGCYAGARQAVDEYFVRNGIVPLLHRVDYTGRVMVKAHVDARDGSR